MVKQIKSRLQNRKLAKRAKRKSCVGWIIQVIAVFIITLGIFLFETGKLDFKQPSETAKVAQKLEKEIEQTSETTKQIEAEIPEPTVEPVVRPMTVERQDFDDGYTELGTIAINKVGIDLTIIKGAGSTEQSSYDKLFYACTDKVDAVLGQDNFVLASHSSQNDAKIGFSSLLLYKDGTLDSHRSLDISQLQLKIDDLITIYQNSDEKYYTFKISSIDGDESLDHQLVTDKMADIEGKPQLTLYACAAVGNNSDGRIVVQADFVSSTS